MGLNTYSALRVEDGGYWFPSSDINAFFYIDNKNEMHYKGYFNDVSQFNSWEICKVMLIDEKVLFFSRRSFEMWIYNTLDESLKKIKYCDEKVSIISNVELFDNNIWIFPDTYSCPILKLNLKDMSTSRVDWGCDSSLGINGIIRTVLFDGCIYWTNRNENSIYVFKLNCKSEEIDYQLYDKARYVNCIDVYCDNLVLLYLDKNNRTILAKIKDNEIVFQKDLTYRVTLQDGPGGLEYFRMVYRNDKFFMFSAHKNAIQIFNEKTNAFIDVKHPNKKTNSITYNDVQLINDEAYLYSPGGMGIIVINLSDCTIKTMKVDSKKAFIQAINSSWNQGVCVSESEDVGVEDLCKYLVNLKSE